MGKIFSKKPEAIKITLWDKIFSFSDASVQKYLKDWIWEYYSQIDQKKDFIKRDYLFLLKETWYVFLLFMFFLIILFYSITFYLKIWKEVETNWFNLTIFISSFVIFLLFFYFSIKARFVNPFSIFISIIFIVIELSLIKEIIMTIEWFYHFIFNASFVVFSIFILETNFKFLKVIYNKYVDYKNDFIVIYPKWIYYSDKDWVLDHIHTRIEFEKISNIEAKQEWFFWWIFNYWTLRVATMWALEDIIFTHCSNITEAWKRLDNVRLDYISRKEKWEISHLEIKPFKSSLRSKIMDILHF